LIDINIIKIIKNKIKLNLINENILSKLIIKVVVYEINKLTTKY